MARDTTTLSPGVSIGYLPDPRRQPGQETDI
jgi:hypothetical protein